MKKLLERDKKRRKEFLKNEVEYFVLGAISKNCNFLTFTRWNAILKLNKKKSAYRKVNFNPRCTKTFNKKRFNKTTRTSRHIYLKQLRATQITGFARAEW